MKPQISVIVPVYNREHLVERCLDSIIGQDVKPYELIVVDNNSTDGSRTVIESWMQRHTDAGLNFLLLDEKKPGACAARQKGLENAVGEWVSFFDSDDTMRKDLISSAEEAIKKNPDCDIVCWKCCLHLFGDKIKIPEFNLSRPIENHLIHTLLRPQGYMVRRDFLEKAGGWSKDIKVWNDFELGMRLLLRNPRIVGVDKVLADIYSQEDSITGKDFSSKQGLWELTLSEMAKENDSRSHPFKKKIEKILRYRKAILAAQYHREGNVKAAEYLFTSSRKDTQGWEWILHIFAYHYTRMGMRGAWRIIGRFY